MIDNVINENSKKHVFDATNVNYCRRQKPYTEFLNKCKKMQTIVVRLFSNEVATFLFQVVMAQRSYMEWLEGRSYLNVIQISLKNRNHLSSKKNKCLPDVTLYEHCFLDNKTTNYNPNSNIIGNPTNKTVTMKNLNVSNEGKYVCYVTYSSDADVKQNYNMPHSQQNW